MTVLLGRDPEAAHLQALTADLRRGQGSALVVHGEAGIGKTALLEQVERSAPDLRVVRALGFHGEHELAFAGLHQLCQPFFKHLDRLPGSQRTALWAAFGLASGAPSHRSTIGLAVLGLLSRAAEDRPLLCIVDDAQWLDRASGEVLGVVARRLHAERVLMIFATREVKDYLDDLPELPLAGLDQIHSHELLRSALPQILDERVRARIVAEAHGNPLALIELFDMRSMGEMAGGFARPDAQPRSGQVDASYLRRVNGFPAPLKLLLLTAATDAVGDPSTLRRAAARLGIDSGVLGHATVTGLIEIGDRVVFQHPLIRSAIYGAAAPGDRRKVHRALADVIDAETEPDRNVWHRAQATSGPDNAVASDLADAAERAQRRGSSDAAAAYLTRAAQLTPDAPQRAMRELAAARAHHLRGAPGLVLRLLALAESGPLDELGLAEVELLKAQVAYAETRGADSPTQLLRAADLLGPVHPDLSRQAYLDALWAAHSAGRLARGVTLVGVARAGRSVFASRSIHPSDLLMDGLTTAAIDGYVAAVPVFRRTVAAFRSPSVDPEEEVRWLGPAGVVALNLWDDESLDLLATRHVEIGRERGAIAVLLIALGARILSDVLAGRFAQAAGAVEELQHLTDLMRIPPSPYGPMLLAAWKGGEVEASDLIDAAVPDLMARGEGAGFAMAQYARAVLYNGLGRYSEAFAAATDSDQPDTEGFTVVNLCLVELIEAATRSGHTDAAAAAMGRLHEMSEASGTEWALGNRARSQALLSFGATAESLYQEAIERLGRTTIRVQLARAHLLYGEWLRREGRRRDARVQLRTAHVQLTAIGARAFAERARHELQATGETVRARTLQAHDQLTAQEAQIARLAAAGRTNPEIGAKLFISARTVEWHLRNVYPKLGIDSRRKLRAALTDTGPVPAIGSPSG